MTATRERAALGVIRDHRGIVLVTLGCAAFYLLGALPRYPHFQTDGYDLGIFDQVVRAYAHFSAPMSPLKGQGYNIYGDHFHPIIAALVPLYWIWDSPVMLIIGQALVVAAAIPLVYRFTSRRTDSAMALAIAAAFGVGWPVVCLANFDFHEIAFATPLMALALDAVDRRSYGWAVSWCGLLLLVREDMGVLVALLGVFLWARSRRLRPPWYSAVLVVGGLAVYGLLTSVLLPSFAPNGEFAYWQYDALGTDVPDALAHIATRPWHAARLFFTPAVKIETLAMLLLPLALLPLRSPYAVLTLPIFAERFFNSREHLWTTEWQYNALPWLILVLAAVDGADRFGLFSRPVFRRAFAAWLAAFPVFYFATWQDSANHSDNPVRRLGSSTTERMRAQSAAVSFVPDHVCVEADDRIVTHLTMRDNASLPPTQNWTADFIVLDFTESSVGNWGPAPADYQRDATSRGYHEVFRSGPVVVLQSPTYHGPTSECAPLGRGR